MKINIGIDLGTTYSAAAAFDKQKGEAVMLKNSSGNYYTPSVICIENGKVTIGEQAKEEMSMGNADTAAFYKSFMGDNAYTMRLDNKEYTAQDLSGLFLKEFIKDIESANGVEIDGVVITVPAYFNEHQRNATIQAGKTAGLNVLKIINEPTAAIIAYGLTGSGKKNVLVYDLGGGTFDVTIACVNGAAINVLTTNGNHELGGKLWDKVIVDELVRRFKEEFDIDLQDTAYMKNLLEVRVKAEDIKKKLTSLNEATAVISCEGYTGRYTVTKDFFEDATATLLVQTQFLIEKCFAELGGGFGWNSLDEVVLVGGSTRMPQVKDFIMSNFKKPPVTKNINVDTIVAQGAAMQCELCRSDSLVLRGAAAAIGGKTEVKVLSSNISDITAHALGMLAFDKSGEKIINSVIIPKNSRVNEHFEKNYTFNGQKMEVYVLQNDIPDPYASTLLYKYSVTGMSGDSGIIVDYLYNNNGVVDVSARHKSGDKLNVDRETVSESIDEIIKRLLEEKEKAKSRRRNIEVELLVDVSGSMFGTPIKKAMEAANSFVNGLNLSSTKVSVIAFGDFCHTRCGFISDKKKIKDAVNSLASVSAGGGTSAQPLKENGDKFSNEASDKIIVVLTDGVWSMRDVEIAAAAKLKSRDVRIYAIGFGSADENFLNKIASYGCGQKIDLGSLTGAVSQIAASIAQEE